ncbi:MAG: DUF4294 domain-containing protein [Flavobacterium sp.]|nr:DUF4294 domain-containing protein [Flavobacterium sp.]
MQKLFFLFCTLFTISLLFSQTKLYSQEKEDSFKEIDTILNDTILLQEVHIYKEKLDPEAKKQFLLLQNRVYVTYPFAKTAGERLTMMNINLEKLKTNKEKKRYFKIIEDFMENEFKAKLKKLSRKQGQILVKLIYRQTGSSTYDLIKDYKSGWKAFWSNNTAKLFDIDLKRKYEPFQENEDYLIETILTRAFDNHRLIEQKSANPVDIVQLNDFWQNKVIEISKRK